MASTSPTAEVTMKPSLGLTGVTINAMALIAPGAFLWTTYQLQAAPGSALNMWPAVFIATAISMLTAIAYSSLSRRYPEGGTGSAYYYAEAAVLQQEEHRHFKWARFAKFLVGWASHLYYWIYPGVMVAFMGTVITYIIQSFAPSFGILGTFVGDVEVIAVCVIFAAVIGSIAYIGVQGSTVANIIMNVVQITGLLVFSILAIVYRVQHPNLPYLHTSALSVLLPHDLGGLMFQSTIAILLIVGFESCTALAAEAKNPGRDIPRAVLLSLLIQAVIFYFFEYFAANFVVNSNIKFTGGGTGFAGAYASGAPIGDIAKYLGDAMLGGNGTVLSVVLAACVIFALLGTTLSCLNTGVRVTYTMGKDKEMPVIFGFLHGKFRTPHTSIILLTVLSAIIGSYGVLDIDKLTQITLMSNIGTFLLYGMACVICILAFIGVKGRNWFTTFTAPLLGAILNVLMLIGVAYYDLATQGAAVTRDTIVAIVISLVWLVGGFGYLFGRKVIKGIPIFHGEDHKEKIESGEASSAPAPASGD